MFRFTNHALRGVLAGLILLLLSCPLMIFGCSGSGSPLSPSDQLPAQDNLQSSSEPNRTLLGFYNLYFGEDRTSCELLPARDTTWHLNVLHFSEYFDPGGVTVDGFEVQPDDTIIVGLQFSHPLPLVEYTIFDVRGILMMPAEYVWPEHEVNTPGLFIGQSALLNAEGYTRRWNPLEFSDNPVPFSYFDGPLTAGMGKNVQTLVNPYITYQTGTPRRFFEIEKNVTNHFHISLDPDQAMVGLAFDCSWEEPDPPGAGGMKIPADFPTTANSLEPFVISIAGQENQLECSVGIWAGGSTNLLVMVRDWQDDAYMPFEQVSLEIPELYDGVAHPWTGEGSPQAYTYQFNLLNDKIFEPTTLVGLFSIEAPEMDNFWTPDIPLTSYQLITLDVVEVNPPLCNGDQAVHTDYGGAYTVNNSYGNLHLDSSFLPVEVAGEGGLIFDGGISGGTEYVQTALIAPFGGNTSANTIITRSGYSAGNAFVVQTNDYNGHILIVSDADPDNLLVFNATGQLLREYDLGMGENGHNQPVCLTTNPLNGDVWYVGDKGSQGIHLERLAYLEQEATFEYVFHPGAKLDLSPWLDSEKDQPLGLGINTHYNMLYLFHEGDHGTIERFDISQIPVIHDDVWSRSGIFDQALSPIQVEGIRKVVGSDLVIDHADGDLDAQCRILVFANTQDGGSKLAKLDVWCQTLGTASLGSSYSCMAINNYSVPSNRCLVLFPSVMVNEFVVFLAPADW